MARQIEDIIVKLGLQGFEGLDKIRGSFRDLSKVTNMSERDINAARNSLFEFAKTAGNTEAVNRGLISAITGLRTQADMCGESYRSLTRDLQRLNEVQRGATDTLMAQRNALVATFSETTRNIRALQEHRAALVRIQDQTRQNSRAYDTLSGDIAQISERIQEVTRVATGLNIALSRAFPATAAGVRATLANLNAGIELQRQVIEEIDLRSGRERRLAATIEERARAEQVLNRALTAQRQLTFGEAVRSGREAVRTAAAAFNEPTLTTGYYSVENIGRRMGDLPDTTAGLNQELVELSERLNNTIRGSQAYVNVAIRMAEVQRQLRTDVMGTSEAFRQLSIAEAGAERRAGKLAGIQEYYSTQGPLAPGVGGYRDPATGAMIARGAYTPGRIRVEESAYPRPIGPQPFPEAATAAQRQIEAAQKDINSIYERAYVQRAELQSKYEQIHVDKLLEGLDLEGQVRQRAFTQELADFDKQLAARESRRRRRLTGMQLAQGVGAALSGGIFGGPEGLIGGLGGLAFGGVGGAFAGAAAGAQVGMFRQQLGAVTDYSARIDKLQIALRGIVGSQAAYSQALAAAASVTRDLNIPQETAIQGMTRLSAAVQGAGGTVNDSAFAFRAISEAVKATGGDAEQADGALLALTQVFSKGKVSAEELNQIAERLPGTFTLFAQAAGKTGPELQKALQQGKVGLNDLMKFLQLISSNYGQTALKIAASSQEAGARLSVAFKNMQLEVGRALQPIGAQIQDSLTNALRAATPALVEFTSSAAALIKILIDNSGLIAGILKTLLGFGAVAGVVVGMTQLVAAVSSLTALTTGLTGLGGAMGVATLAAESLGIAIAAIPGIGWVAAGTAALALLSTELYNNNYAFRTWANNLATVISTDFKNAWDNAASIVSSVAGVIVDIWNGTGSLISSVGEGIANTFNNLLGGVFGRIAQFWNNLPEPVRRAMSQGATNAAGALLAPGNPAVGYLYGAGIRAAQMGPNAQATGMYGRYAPAGIQSNTPPGSLTRLTLPTSSDPAGRSAANRLQQDFNNTITQLGRQFNTAAKTKLYDTVLNFEDQIQKAYRNNNIALAEELKLKQKAAALDITEEVLMSEKESLQTKLNEARTKGLDTQNVQNRLDAVSAELKQIQVDRTKDLTAELEKQAQKVKELRDIFQQVFAPSSLAGGIFNLSGISPGYTFGEGDIFQNLGKSTSTEQVTALATELNTLVTPLTQIQGAAEAIGNAFSTSFTNIISGAATTREVLATLFNNIANYFLDMAGKIIAKWIEMAILNTVLNLIPGGRMFGVGSSKFDLPDLSGAGALAGGNSIAGATDWASQSGGFFAGLKLNAMGAAYAANGIVPYAMGGVVKRPTMFAFADGGAGRLGLMAEAGPEAIMPLRRLPSGRLGVESAGGGTTNVVVNVDASGSQIQGDAGRGEQLGRAVSAAVQAELIKQKRPGGLLS